jgi:hypothetical protein
VSIHILIYIIVKYVFRKIKHVFCIFDQLIDCTFGLLRSQKFCNGLIHLKKKKEKNLPRLGWDNWGQRGRKWTFLGHFALGKCLKIVKQFWQFLKNTFLKAYNISYKMSYISKLSTFYNLVKNSVKFGQFLRNLFLTLLCDKCWLTFLYKYKKVPCWYDEHFIWTLLPSKRYTWATLSLFPSINWKKLQIALL